MTEMSDTSIIMKNNKVYKNNIQHMYDCVLKASSVEYSH
jgi:hypothetical protein